ncbi:1-acyl-sn-glycerol-3-phosphate acyltransferase [Treponema pectinovorum]|uniref:lysophospholipid acyltransferase family protein n=1 Tax=Treponema pectinovorum TaxID=164 RepID=UPI003D8DB5B4
MFKIFITIVKIFFWMLGKNSLRRKGLKLEKQGKVQELDSLVLKVVPLWAQHIAKVTGTTVVVNGLEKLPQDRAVVFIANHQGYMDIPAIYGYVPKFISFVSKKEIGSIPLIGDWMRFLHCTLMDRKNARASVKAIHDAADNVKRGYSQVIFPEGTRSRGGLHREFKAGSFKLAFLSQSPIVPLTIEGSYKVFEEEKTVSKGNTITITIHDPIETAGLSRDEQSALPEKIENIICAQLKPYEDEYRLAHSEK